MRVEVTSRAGGDLHSRDALGADALGGVLGLQIAFDHADADPAANRLDGGYRRQSRGRRSGAAARFDIGERDAGAGYRVMCRAETLGAELAQRGVSRRALLKYSA